MAWIVLYKTPKDVASTILPKNVASTFTRLHPPCFGLHPPWLHILDKSLVIITWTFLDLVFSNYFTCVYYFYRANFYPNNVEISLKVSSTKKVYFPGVVVSTLTPHPVTDVTLNIFEGVG